MLSLTIKATDAIADEIDFTQTETVEGRPEPVFKEYREIFEVMDEGVIIPGLEDAYVPQGIEYIESEDLIVTTHYDNNELGSSVLGFTNRESGEFVKYLSLYLAEGQRYKGHAGGVAISEKYIWVASGANVYKFSLEEAIEKESGDNLVAKSIHEISTRGSFITYNDGILWAGEFSLPESHKDSSRYVTDSSHHMKNRDGVDHKSITLGYVLEDDEFPESGKSSYALSHTDRTQGMSFTRDQIYLSHSYGRGNNSDLGSYKNVLKEDKHGDIEVEGENVPLWFLDNKSKNLEKVLPPMSEGIVAIGDKLHVLFESGARKFLTVTKRYPLDRVQIVDLEKFDKLERDEMPEEEPSKDEEKDEGKDEEDADKDEESPETGVETETGSETVEDKDSMSTGTIVLIVAAIAAVLAIGYGIGKKRNKESK